MAICQARSLRIICIPEINTCSIMIHNGVMEKELCCPTDSRATRFNSWNPHCESVALCRSFCYIPVNFTLPYQMDTLGCPHWCWGQTPSRAVCACVWAYGCEWGMCSWQDNQNKVQVYHLMLNQEWNEVKQSEVQWVKLKHHVIH